MDDEVFNIMKKSVEAKDAEEAYNAIKKSVEAINTRPYATLAEYEKVECIKILLTSYEKQQKEIEKLKDELKECVHKDKIRDIIFEFIPKSNHEVVLRAKIIKLLGEQI